MGNHVVVEKDIARFQITVDNWDMAMVVEIVKSLSNVEGNAHSFTHG